MCTMMHDTRLRLPPSSHFPFFGPWSRYCAFSPWSLHSAAGFRRRQRPRRCLPRGIFWRVLARAVYGAKQPRQTRNTLLLVPCQVCLLFYTMLYVPSVFVLVADAGVYAQQSEGAGTVRSRQGHLLRVAHLVHTLAPSPPPPQRSFPAAREHHQEVLEIRT